jgi:hypothetical protein
MVTQRNSGRSWFLLPEHALSHVRLYDSPLLCNVGSKIMVLFFYAGNRRDPSAGNGCFGKEEKKDGTVIRDRVSQEYP